MMAEDTSSGGVVCGEDPAVEATKWFCEYCTYANFPSSLKCTMCKGQKPLLNEDIFRLNNKNLAASHHHLDILDSESLLLPSGDNDEEEEEESRLLHDEDICTGQRLLIDQPPTNSPPRNSSSSIFASSVSPSPHKPPPPTPTTTTTSSSLLTDGKWPCVVCTYLNWPIALRCTQCLTERNQSSSPLLDATNAEEDLLTAAAEHLQRTLSIRSTSPQAEASSAASANTATTTITSVIKWRCIGCTYENFPKSQKCSMCACGRPEAQLLAASATAKRDLVNNNLNNNKATLQRSNSSSPSRVSPTMAAAAMGAMQIIETEDKQQLINLDQLANTGAGGGGYYHNNSNSLTRKHHQNNNNNNNNQSNEERHWLRKLRKHADWRWLHACMGVVENNFAAVEEYLSYGGSPGRALTAAEVTLLNRNSAFDVGFTLIHLAIRFQREDMLPMMLSQISGTGTGIKRVPSYIAPDLAADIRRQFSTLLRVRKGPFSCHYVQEHATFALPSEIEDLPLAVQEQLYEELLDKDAQKQLENPPPGVLNWSLEITVRLGSRLVVLWNRSAGDCLLDSAMQATWGIFDRDNVLRRALADSLHQCAHLFYPRWKEYEMIQASLMHFQLEEAQWQQDWANLLALASQPGASLEQLHIFALAHIFRRPVIVYGVKFVKSFRGEDIGFARFEGVYLPLIWEPSFCSRSPIALGYTRGHFSALVPMESYSSRLEATNDEDEVTFLPLMDSEMKMLPIHFINETEMGREESLMRQWLDVCMTEGGLMVAQQRLSQRPLLVAQMVEEWLNYYRRLAQVFSAPFARRPQLTGYSSDNDTEEE